MRAACRLFPALFVLVACGSSSGSASNEAPDGGAPPNDASTGADSPTTADASSPDASVGTPVDAGPFVPGAPITATASEWTWVPFPEATCGNGSSTGIGVNLSATGTDVLIYLEGGGGCWNAETCYAFQSAANFTTGYSQTTFEAESTDATYLAEPGGFFDRTASANPFKDYSYVYVPYCTGDIHGGSNVVQLGSMAAHFTGYSNFAAYLRRVVPTFATASRVILSGSSAGGFGALLNWGQTQSAFGAVRVDVLDDSGTFMPLDVVAEGNGDGPTQSTAWNLPAAMPAGCAACATDPSALYAYYAKLYPTHREALLSYTADSVLPSYAGISTAEFTTGLDEILTDDFAPNANMQSFIYTGAGHVLFFDPQLTTGGVTLQTFVTEMVTDSTSWSSPSP
jgi:hypothetical protein